MSRAFSRETDSHGEEVDNDNDALYLPRGIINNILKQLPVKTFIRFQCVCKEWKDLFKTRSFIAEHLRHSTQQNDFLLCKESRFNQNPSLCLINRHMQVIDYEKVSPYVLNHCIVGSSNGLLCLGSSYPILLNLATREIFHVPKVKFSWTEIWWNLATGEGFHVPKVKRYTEIWDICGFGFSPNVNDYFDQKTNVNDYKIVMFSLSKIVDDSYRVCVGKVFSLRTNSWIEVEAGKLKDISLYGSKYGFTFDGAIFWFGTFDEMKCGNSLISFDIATKSLTLISVPSHVSDYSPVFDNRLTMFDNKLAMLSSEMYINSMGSVGTKLWVIEKCGDAWVWTNIYKQSLLLIVDAKYWLFGEIKLFGNNVQPLYSLEMAREEWTNLNIDLFCAISILTKQRYWMSPKGFEVWNVVESLVSPSNIQMEASSS